MKTTLTLQSGSFYFTGYVSLVRGRSVVVNLADLPAAELQALKRSVTSGVITSSESIGDYSKVESVETPAVAEPEVKEAEATVVQETPEVEVEDTPKRKPTRKPTVSKADTDDADTAAE